MEPEDLAAEIFRRFESRNKSEDIVSICAYEYKEFRDGKLNMVRHWLSGKPEETIFCKPITGYVGYSHGICNECLEKYHPE